MTAVARRCVCRGYLEADPDDADQVDRLEQVVAELRQVGQGMILAGTGVSQAAEGITAAIDRVRTAPTVQRPAAAPQPVRQVPRLPVAVTAPAEPSAGPTGEISLGKAERAILAALAAYPTGLSRPQLAFLAGYHPNSKGLVNALGSLRSAGLVSQGFPATLTQAGAAQGVQPMEMGNVAEFWLSRFGRAERAIFGHLLEIYPQSAERAELGQIAGYDHPNSKGYANALGRLRGLGLVNGFALHPDFAHLVGR